MDRMHVFDMSAPPITFYAPLMSDHSLLDLNKIEIGKCANSWTLPSVQLEHIAKPETVVEV